MSKAILYIRVSTKEQEEENYSLDAQEKLGIEYARRKGLELVRIWRVSESAWHKERKNFNDMLEFVRAHKEIEHVIFDITDRMTRNDTDKLKINELINIYGKTIHFSRSNKILNKASAPDDEFMLDIEVAVAKKYSNDISRRARMGQSEKAEQGYYPSYAPIGYINNLKEKTLEIDTERAPFIKRAFELVASGTYSIKMVATVLYKNGFRSRTGLLVDKSCIHRILHNRVYYGLFSWDGKSYAGKHAPLISRQLYEKVQEVLHGKNHYSTQRKEFAFTNLVVCGTCGSKVIGEMKKNKYIYYHCTYSKGRHKGEHYIPEHRLAEMLYEPINAIHLPVDKQEWMLRAVEESFKDQERAWQERQAAQLQQLKRLERRLDKLYDDKFDGVLDADVLTRKEQEYKNQIAELKQQIATDTNINTSGVKPLVKTFELANKLPMLYLRATNEQKAQLARLVASNYTLVDGKPCPAYKKPFSFLPKGPGRSDWLGDRHSNPDTMVQSHVSCRWTIPHPL